MSAAHRADSSIDRSARSRSEHQVAALSAELSAESSAETSAELSIEPSAEHTAEHQSAELSQC